VAHMHGSPTTFVAKCVYAFRARDEADTRHEFAKFVFQVSPTCRRWDRRHILLGHFAPPLSDL
jgi:hypothetical protein